MTSSVLFSVLVWIHSFETMLDLRAAAVEMENSGLVREDTVVVAGEAETKLLLTLQWWHGSIIYQRWLDIWTKWNLKSLSWFEKFDGNIKIWEKVKYNFSVRILRPAWWMYEARYCRDVCTL